MFIIPLAKSAYILAALTLLSLVGCQRNEHQARWWQGEEERIRLENEVKVKSFCFDERLSGEFEEYSKIQQLIAANKSRAALLETQRNELIESLENLKVELVAFKKDAIQLQRSRALGKTYGKLELASGRIFQDVAVTAITDAGVAIRHAHGSARLRFADLDDTQRRFFALEADLAGAEEEREKQAASEYENWIDQQTAQIRAAEDLVKTRKAAEDLRKCQAAQQLAAGRTERPQTAMASPVGLRSNWEDDGASRYRSSYSSSRPRYRYVTYYNPCNSYSGHRLKTLCGPIPNNRFNNSCTHTRHKKSSLADEGNLSIP